MLIWILFLFLIPTHHFTQSITYHAELTNIQFGKPFKVIYTLPSETIQILNIDTNIMIKADTDITLRNINYHQIEAEITSFGLTPYKMPSFSLTVLFQDGTTNILSTPNFMIPISNEAPSNITLADIEQPYFVWDHLWTILILGMIGILCLLFLWKKLHIPSEAPIIEPVIDPFLQIEHKLQTLKIQKNSLTEETYKDFFVELSEAIREFLSLTLVPLALETPTRELLSTLKSMNTEEELLEIISFIAKSCDQAKYAKQIFGQERIDHIFSESNTLVALIAKKKKVEEANELRGS